MSKIYNSSVDRRLGATYNAAFYVRDTGQWPHHNAVVLSLAVWSVLAVDRKFTGDCVA